MRVAQHVNCVYTHTEGEPTCIVLDGVHFPANSSIWEKRRHLEESYDWLRQALMREPRGHKDMFGVFLTPPSTEEANAGMIWMDGDRFIDMCGHGTIALSMVLASHGWIPALENTVDITLESTAGLVRSRVALDEGIVSRAEFENVPAFVVEQRVPVTLPGLGDLFADIVFGGNFFAIVELSDPNLRITPENGRRLSELGMLIKRQINEVMCVEHPLHRHIRGVNFVTFYHEPSLPGSLYRNVHVFSAGQLDRSPGGTGTSAMMALFEARGLIGIGDTIFSEGLLGSGQFEGRLIGETTIGPFRAVNPVVGGSAKVLGYTKWVVDPTDALGLGLVVA